jgi:MFS family permease
MTASSDAASASQASRDVEAYPSAARAWGPVVLLSALYALSLLDRQVMALLIDDIRADLKITDFQVSLLQGISFALFYATFGLLFGRAVDRVSRRGVISTGVTIWSLATAACGLARNFAGLAMARFGVGAGEAALAPAAYSMIADSFPKTQLALAMAVFGIGSTIGTGMSNAVGGLVVYLVPKEGLVLPLLGLLEPWRVVFLAAGLPGLIFAALIFLVAEPVRRGRRADGGGTQVRDVVRFIRERWKFFLGHFFGFGMQSMCAYAVMSWQAMYFTRKFHWDIPKIAMILTIVNLIAAFSTQLLVGYVADRWYRRGVKDAYLRLCALCGVVQIFAIAFAMTANNPWAAMAGLLGWAFFANTTGPAAAAIQLVTPNEFRGQVSATYILVFNLLGVGAGATVAGAFTTYLFKDDLMVGWSILLTFLIFMPIAICFLIFAMKPMREATARLEAEAEAEAEAAG